MLRRFCVFVFALLCCQGALAKEPDYTFSLGTYGLSTLSEVSLFFTDKASLWKDKGIQVYDPSGQKRYRKTNWRMHHLPKQAKVVIAARLAPKMIKQYPSAVSAEYVCAGIIVWKCRQRMETFNPNSSDYKKSWQEPKFFASAPEMPKLPRPSVLPLPVVPNVIARIELAGLATVAIMLLSFLAIIVFAPPERLRKNQLPTTKAPPRDTWRKFRGWWQSVSTRKNPKKQSGIFSTYGNPVQDPVNSNLAPAQKIDNLKALFKSKGLPIGISDKQWPEVIISVNPADVPSALKLLKDNDNFFLTTPTKVTIVNTKISAIAATFI